MTQGFTDGVFLDDNYCSEYIYWKDLLNSKGTRRGVATAINNFVWHIQHTFNKVKGFRTKQNYNSRKYIVDVLTKINPHLIYSVPNIKKYKSKKAGLISFSVNTNDILLLYDLMKREGR